MGKVPGSPDAPQRRQLSREAPSVPEDYKEWARTASPAELEAFGAELARDLLERWDDGLRERVAALEEQLAGMATEVRTRRLAVVDEHDVERVVAECEDLSDRPAEVRAQSPDGQTWAGLSVHAAEGGWAPSVALWLDGEDRGRLSAVQRPERRVESYLYVGDDLVAEGMTDELGRAVR